jgi:hypothetical protein
VAALSLANAPWPLKELHLLGNDFSAAAAPTALAALSRQAGLRDFDVGFCSLSTAGFMALVEATWTAWTSLVASYARKDFGGPHTLGVAAFAGFPALEELNLQEAAPGEAGAALLASRRWPRLKKLDLRCTDLGAAGDAVLAHRAWPALERLGLSSTASAAGRAPTLADTRCWAPTWCGSADVFSINCSRSSQALLARRSRNAAGMFLGPAAAAAARGGDAVERERELVEPRGSARPLERDAPPRERRGLAPERGGGRLLGAARGRGDRAAAAAALGGGERRREVRQQEVQEARARGAQRVGRRRR